MDDGMKVVWGHDYIRKLAFARDDLREHMAACTSEFFRYLCELGRQDDENHPIRQLWLEKLSYVMGHLACGCRTIEEVDEMHAQLNSFAKQVRDIYNKELQTLGGPTK
ncbi:MAG: hypothetical protein LBL34_01250 [Clostridiales bacterium]|jgi:hypothetical protein|nr:hypothetical protein [Clostridiales bacterium]